MKTIIIFWDNWTSTSSGSDKSTHGPTSSPWPLHNNSCSSLGPSTSEVGCEWAPRPEPITPRACTYKPHEYEQYS